MQIEEYYYDKGSRVIEESRWGMHITCLIKCLNAQHLLCLSTVTMDVFLLKSLEKQMLEHISSLFCLFYLSSVVMIIKYLHCALDVCLVLTACTVPLMYAWC